MGSPLQAAGTRLTATERRWCKVLAEGIQVERCRHQGAGAPEHEMTTCRIPTVGPALIDHPVLPRLEIRHRELGYVPGLCPGPDREKHVATTGQNLGPVMTALAGVPV